MTFILSNSALLWVRSVSDCWMTVKKDNVHVFTRFFYVYVHMQVLIYRDYLKFISISVILSHIANGTINNDQDTEEEVLV